ncbi:MAG: SDR family oxidoreductase, partial [Candidatus Marinimicrobia bacterium]|nr:SDR family oxidoreductase [Candidatus Neomarinimicrobiota bacterium]
MTVLKSIIATLFLSTILLMMPSFNSVTADITDEDELILVVGASGRTGSYVIKYLKQQGRNFVPMTSNKDRATKKFSEKYNWVEADVKKPESLDSIMVGVTKIISGLGTNEYEGPNSPEYIDYGGTKNLINAAEKAGTVNQFIQISSSGVTHKDHPLNRFGNILVWKLKAEDYIRSSSIAHTIIRPGG